MRHRIGLALLYFALGAMLMYLVVYVGLTLYFFISILSR